MTIIEVNTRLSNLKAVAAKFPLARVVNVTFPVGSSGFFGPSWFLRSLVQFFIVVEREVLRGLRYFQHAIVPGEQSTGWFPSLNPEMTVDGQLGDSTFACDRLWIEFPWEDSVLSLPPGSSAVLQRKPVTEFAVGRIGMRGRQVLVRSSIPTRRTLHRNHVDLVLEAFMTLQSLCQKSIAPAEEQDRSCSATQDGRSLSNLNSFHFFRYLATVPQLVHQKIFPIRDSWNVAVKTSTEGFGRRIAISEGMGRNCADPFLFQESNKTYCVVEEFGGDLPHGRIATYDVTNPDRPIRVSEVHSDIHMSFPAIFNFRGRHWMTPECASGDSQLLFVWKVDEKQWEQVESSMSNLPANLDPLVFEYGNIWWLFSSPAVGETIESPNSLLAFYTDNPVNGEWKEHHANPIVRGAWRARNGGIVKGTNELLRIAQNPGFGEYGKGVEILRIQKLTPYEYSETLLGESLVLQAGHRISTHHYSVLHGWSAYDYRSRNFRQDAEQLVTFVD